MIFKRLSILCVCFVGSILSIFLLKFISANANQRKNNFVRLLPSNVIVPGDIIDLKTSGWNFMGYHRKSIFLGNLYSPEQFLKLGSSLKDSMSTRVVQPKETKLTKGYFNLIDDGTFYTLDGNQPILLEGKITNPILKLGAKPPYFTQAVHTCDKSFILRVVQGGKNRLVTYRTDSAGFVAPYDFLEKQVDGVFCTDGKLIKIPGSGKIIYIYYYRNQFICADNNLKLLYKGKTIDTVSTAKVKVAYIKSSNETTLSAPPTYVNKQSTANEKYLFVHSGLIADNEVEVSLQKVSVIDVYNISDGSYELSFYLPDFNRKKLTDFRVYDKNLYALYDNYLYKYKLNF